MSLDKNFIKQENINCTICGKEADIFYAIDPTQKKYIGLCKDDLHVAKVLFMDQLIFEEKESINTILQNLEDLFGRINHIIKRNNSES